MIQPTDIHEGMVVRGPEGEVLGRVFAVGDDSFEVEKGLFFPKEYRVEVSDVDDIRDGEIVLAYGPERLRPADPLSSAEPDAGGDLAHEPTYEEEEPRETEPPGKPTIH